MDNQELIRENLDPKGSFFRSIGREFVRLLKGQRGFALAGEGGGEGEGSKGEEGGAGAGGESGTGGDTGDKGKGTSINWFDGIPDEELKAHPSFKNFKNENLTPVPVEVLKSFINKDKLLGRDKVPLPKDPDDKVAWNAFYEQMGVPKDVNGYVLPTEIEGIEAEALTALRDEKMEGSFKTWAKEANLLPHQVEAIYKNYLKYAATSQKELNDYKEEARRTADVALRKELGLAYDSKIAHAQSLIDKFADKELSGLINDGLGNDPAWIRFIVKVAENFTEDTITGKGREGFTLTPEEAQRELNKMIADLKSPLYDKTHPEHEAYVQKKIDLGNMAHPEESK